MLHNHIKKVETKSFIPLTNFTTLKVGGPAEFLAEPNNVEELENLLSWSRIQNYQCHFIGAGSNILVNDNGLKGLTICTKKLHGYNINNKTGIIDANSGEALPNLARKAAKEGLHGLEWAVGIPGTIGGGIVMNAGAQGGCIADRLISVKVYCLKNRKIYEIEQSKLEYSYRKSLLQDEKLIVISSRFQLEPGFNAEELIKVTNQNLQKRLKSQPYHLPSCGSVFKNPPNGKAGQIIESLGLKGLKEGEAEVSSMHANFIVNKGFAKASDISRLISIIQTKVQQKRGFLLHPEVKRLGFE